MFLQHRARQLLSMALFGRAIEIALLASTESRGVALSGASISIRSVLGTSRTLNFHSRRGDSRTTTR